MQNAEFRMQKASAFCIRRQLSLQPRRSGVDHSGLRRTWGDAEWIGRRGSRRPLVVVVDASVNWRGARDNRRRQSAALRYRLWRHANAWRQLRIRTLPNRERRWCVIVVVDDRRLHCLRSLRCR